MLNVPCGVPAEFDSALHRLLKGSPHSVQFVVRLSQLAFTTEKTKAKATYKMAAQKDQTRTTFPRSMGYAIAATGLFASIAATLGSATRGHPYAGLLLGMDAVVFAIGTVMVVLAFRERKRERERE
jgi:hypothetical protein